MTTATKSLYVFLALGILASVLLWMPFGVGYYGVPWDHAGWRIVVSFFVFALPVCALAGCLAAFRGGLSWWRLALALAALAFGLFGVFVMRDWLGRAPSPNHALQPTAGAGGLNLVLHACSGPGGG